MAINKDDSGQIYIDTDPDDDWSGEEAAEEGSTEAGYDSSGGGSGGEGNDIDQGLNPDTPDPGNDSGGSGGEGNDRGGEGNSTGGGSGGSSGGGGSNDELNPDTPDPSTGNQGGEGNNIDQSLNPNTPDPSTGNQGGEGNNKRRSANFIDQSLNPDTPDPQQQDTRLDGFQRIMSEGKDIPQTLNQNRGSIINNIRQIGRETQDLGRALQEEGGDLGQDVEEEVSTTLGGGSAAARGVEQPSGLSERTGQLIGGISTLGTQAGGFFIEGGGGIIELRADDIEDLSEFEGSKRQAEGIKEFGEEVEEQVEEDPVGFVLEEGGEEIGEAAIGGLLLGPVGVALGATPTIEPEVEPEIEQEIEPEQEVDQQVSTLENEVEPENIPETEQVPSGIIDTQTPQLDQERSRTPETFESGGLRRTEMDAGPEVIGRQPTTQEFESNPQQQQSREFVEEDTGFLPEEQEVVRNRRGREDVTLRQEENLLRDFGPGETRPEEGATVLEAEKTETGGELLFSFMGPVPVEPEVEPEQEFNPQPPQADVSGPTTQEFNPNIDMELDQELRFRQEQEPEPITEQDSLIQTENDINTVFTEVETGQDQSQPPIEDQPQENPLQQEPENVFEEPTQETTSEPTVEQEINQFIEPQQEPEPEKTREVNRRAVGTPPLFKLDDTQQDTEIFTNQQPERGPERSPSLDAVLQGITSEETGGDEEFFTGFETRAIEEPSEEEDLNLFF